MNAPRARNKSARWFGFGAAAPRKRRGEAAPRRRAIDRLDTTSAAALLLARNSLREREREKARFVLPADGRQLESRAGAARSWRIDWRQAGSAGWKPSLSENATHLSLEWRRSRFKLGRLVELSRGAQALTCCLALFLEIAQQSQRWQ